jgi:hypothetical protein
MPDVIDPVGDLFTVAALLDELKCPRPSADWVRMLARQVCEIQTAAAESAAGMLVLRQAVNVTLLFHSAGEWDQEKRSAWFTVVQRDEATTKVLCDALRSSLVAVTSDLHHKADSGGFACPVIGKPADVIWTDYRRPGLANACPHCTGGGPPQGATFHRVTRGESGG